MLGIEVAESTVGRYMVRSRRPPSQGWKTFQRNHAVGIASIDLFVVRTISFKLLYGLVILRHARRRMITIGVTTNPTAEWIANQLTDAFPWNEAPKHLVRDRDGAYGPAYLRPGSCDGNPRSSDRATFTMAERVRRAAHRLHPSRVHRPRDCDRRAHLRRVLKAYASYYNEVRTHLSLNKDAPHSRSAQPVGPIAALPVLGGLHHQYVRV